MALGLISKLMILFVVINSVVTFAANSGMIAETDDVRLMKDRIDQLQENNKKADTSIDDSSGINILEYFNPLNYGPVGDFLGIISGFFFDPIILFGTLPAPFSYMFATIFGALETFALAGFIRGFAA